MPTPIPSIHTLGNGLTVALLSLPSARAVHLAFSVQAGPRFEAEEASGASYLFEHVLFHGCEAHPSPGLHSVAFEDVGGAPVATVDLGELTVDLTVPRATLGDALILLGDTVSHPVFAHLDPARIVACQEVEEDYDGDTLVDPATAFYRRMFPRHPSGRPVHGTPRSLARLTEDGLCREHRRLFAAENAVLTLVGDFAQVEAGELLYRVGQHFDLPTGRRLYVPAFEPARRGPPDLLFMGEPGTQTLATLGFHAPPWDDPRGAAARMLLRVLGDGVQSRMAATLRGEKGLCMDHLGTLVDHRDEPFANFLAVAPSATIAEATRALFGMIARVVEQGIYREELVRAKRLLRWEIDRTLDDPEAHALWYGVEVLRDPVEQIGVDAHLARMDAVTLLDVHEAARLLLVPENLTMVVDGAPPAPQAEIREAVNRFATPRLAS